MPTLAVQLLGHFHLTFGGTPVKTFSSPRLQSLLAYLILHDDAPQARQDLAFRFWPDATEANARNNLRQLLHELRHALPETTQFLDIEGTTIQWRADAPFTCDVDDFERAAAEAALAPGARAALENAVAQYRGDLLPGCYDDWVAPEQERLRETFIAALEQLVQLLEQQRDYTAAIGYAQQMLRHDPVREGAYRCLMRLYAHGGDRASALRAYHTCATVLQRELAVEPSAETHAEYERLLHLGAPAAPSIVPLPGNSPLVGRRREWAQVQATWNDAANGKPHLIALEGEAGIGKTRMAEELIAWVNRQGVPHASAHCYAAEGIPAFSPIVAWLRERPLSRLDPIWIAELARLLPELARAHPEWHMMPLTEEWQRQRLFQAIARALSPQAHPLLLLLDDLQWCDRDSLACLHYLLRYDPHARLLIVGTLRTEEIDARHPVTALLRALRQTGQLTEIDLGPLDEPETVSLAGNVLGHPVESPLAVQVYQETEGNPLFIVEMVRAWHLGSRSLPAKVQAATAARLAQLSPPARGLADVAAIIGRDFAFDVLARASEANEDALVRGLDELWRRRIVREHGALTYDFTHAKLREVILAALSPVRSRLLHRRVAQALEYVNRAELDPVSAQIAAHFDQADSAEAAIRYYERAAQVGWQRGSNHEAIEHYRRALELCRAGTPTDIAARLYENLGDVRHWIGQYDQARVSYQSALGCTQNETIACARVQRKVGNTWRERYHYPEALESYAQAERILDQVAADPSTEWWHEWIQAQLESGLVRYWLGQVEQDDQLRRKLETAVDQHGTPAQRAAYFQHVGNIEFRRHRNIATPRIVELAHAALAAYQEAGNDADVPAAQFMIGFRTLWSGDPQGAITPLQTALHLAERTGDVSLQARCLAYLTIACRLRKQTDETRKYATRSLAIAAAVSMPEYIAAAKANQAWIAYRARDSGQARELGDAALALWLELPRGHASAPFQWLALFPLIAVAHAGEQISKAIDYVRALLDPLQQRLPDDLTDMLKGTIRDWDAGEPEAACARLQQALALAERFNYL